MVKKKPFKFGDKVHDQYGGNYIFWTSSPGDKGDCWLIHKNNPMIRGFLNELKFGWDFRPAKRLPRQWGCDGRHYGNGTKECPRELHHHHDEFCKKPKIKGKK